jgi:hypothetical protein
MAPEEDLGFRPGDEVDERRWLAVPDARALLTYQRDQAILDALPDEPLSPG